MFIECKKCKSIYKIEEAQIPKTKSFVRCSKCSEAIPVINPNAKRSDHTEIHCNQCDAHYSIPLSKFKKDRMKVICKKCGAQFYASKNPESNATPAKSENKKITSLTQANQRETTPIVETAQQEVSIEKSAQSAPEIPTKTDKQNELIKEKEFTEEPLPKSKKQIPANILNKDQEADHQFDDLFDDLTKNEPESFPPSKLTRPKKKEEKVPDPEEEYLKSVSLGDQLNGKSSIIGSIPKEQKSKFFLQPGEEIKSEQPQRKKEQPVSGLNLEQSKLDKSDFNNTRIAEKEALLAEANSNQRNSNANKFFLAAATLAIILGIASWFFNNQTDSLKMEIPVTRAEADSQVSITGKPKSRRIKNVHFKNKIYIVQGKLKSSMINDEKLSHIKVKGIIKDKNSNILAESIVYAGNILSSEQLSVWNKQQLINFYGNKDGGRKINLDIAQNSEIPFQIIFLHIKGQNLKTEAKLVSYEQKGKEVLIK